MKEIRVKDKIVLVDDEDYPILSRHPWRLDSHNGPTYAVVGMCGRQIPMHRFVMHPRRGQVIDHINRNTLDNRRCNLRSVSYRDNAMNTEQSLNTVASGVKGVTFHKASGKWRSHFKGPQGWVHVGLFATKELAAAAYERAYADHFGVLA